jgi:hypothetical protein
MFHCCVDIEMIILIVFDMKCAVQSTYRSCNKSTYNNGCQCCPSCRGVWRSFAVDVHFMPSMYCVVVLIAYMQSSLHIPSSLPFCVADRAENRTVQHEQKKTAIPLFSLYIYIYFGKI